MKVRARAWRKKVRRMVGLLDEELAKAHEPLSGSRLLELRERLAGALGAEEGLTSTYELRRRAARDWAEAAALLDVKEPPFEPPPAVHHEPSMKRDLGSFARPWPRTGDGR